MLTTAVLISCGLSAALSFIALALYVHWVWTDVID